MARGRILVIKLSALGDMLLSVAAFQAIRRHHAGAHLVLLTTAPYRELAAASGCFDEVWVDARPAWWDAAGVLALRRRLRAGAFERVYDLQRSQRTAWYFRLLAPGRPEWVGKARGASHRVAMPSGERRHIAEREAGQLAAAGIPPPGPPDLSFLAADPGRFALPARYALLVPGGAAHRPAKRWPAERYAALGARLAAAGTTPVLVGGADDRATCAAVAAACPAARDLCGATSLAELASLAGGAVLAVGNDTGPMHLAAAVGCPSLVLFSRASDPARVAPRGPAVEILQRDDLAALTVDEAEAALRTLADRVEQDAD